MNMNIKNKKLLMNQYQECIQKEKLINLKF